MPTRSDRRHFLRWSLCGAASLAGCHVERKPVTSGSGSSAVARSPGSAGGEGTLVRAAEWLCSRQELPQYRGEFDRREGGVDGRTTTGAALEYGGWRSANYAQLKSGEALTPLVLRALHVARFPTTRCASARPAAEEFLRAHVDASGVIGANDSELLEYPNYATALALPCLLQTQTRGDREIVLRMMSYLVDQQYREANGFGPEHVAYGGWGFGGKLPVGGSAGHMDLAHTRHVLEGLRAAGHDGRETYRRAERFLRLMQKHPAEDREQPSLRNATAGTHAGRSKPAYDGGFYFSPVVLAANKAGETEHEGRPYFRSYATATCEGILALLACGVGRDDERLRAAVAWLQKHPRLDYPEGIPEDQHENWGASIRYYHYAVRSQCYAALDWPGDWRDRIQSELAKRREPDGSFINRDGILMKEDDPMLCTALAVLALGYARKK
jgi:hypothetical protein